jgi:hypothetical protein
MDKNKNKSRKKYTTKIPAVTGDLVKRTDVEEGDDTATPVKEEQSTATKIKPVKGDDGLVDMLMKIYTFMNKNYEDDKLHREEENNLKEGNKLAEKKRHEKLIKAIEDLKKNLGVSDDTASKDNTNAGGGIIDVITSIFGGALAMETLLAIAGAVVSPLGLLILGATSIAALLAMDKNPEETNKMIQNAGGDVSVAGKAVMEAASDLVQGRKNRLLSERPKDKKSLNPFKDADLQKKYLEEIGFDPKTGLTAAEKSAGFTDIDEDFNPIKPKADTTTASPSSPAASAPSAPTAAPAAAAPSSNKLNTVTAENNTAKVDNITKAPSISTINNVTATQGGKTEKPIVPTTKVPPVRNQEPTFQSMIVYSTRVV